MLQYQGFLVDENFNIYSARTGMKLTPYKGSDGYMHVQYRDEKQKNIHQRVHRIYANLFIPNPYKYKYVNHIDGNKSNNNLSNLEWCTNGYNVKHYWESKSRRSSWKTKVVAYDKEGNVYRFNSIRELSRTLNIDRHKVSRILKGETKNTLDYSFNYVC